MSIQSIAGNVLREKYHSVTGTFHEIGSRIQGLLGDARATIGSLWDGGFVGFDFNNYTILTDAIEKHVASMEAIVGNFHEDAVIDGALKGKARDAAKEYVAAIKMLLEAYSTTYREFNLQLTGNARGNYTAGQSANGNTSIMDQYNQGDTANAQAINSEAQSILTEAQNIRID